MKERQPSKRFKEGSKGPGQGVLVECARSQVKTSIKVKKLHAEQIQKVNSTIAIKQLFEYKSMSAIARRAPASLPLRSAKRIPKSPLVFAT